ncbi:hypothetical protein [Nonlabens xiamenensis]|uniref:hypothetical protein n=1 Tax=Nonlabens xiamenensis TaxID=2341043 RepID=UPI000F607DBC|nr:hypothetical protein [Nonlabens xiamenensis]
MKKKIAADLTSLAHRILQFKKQDDVTELQAMAKELYEKLTVLAFAEKHFSGVQPNAGDVEIKRRLEAVYEDAQEDVESLSQDVEEVMDTAQSEVEQAFTSNNLSDLFMPAAEEDTREEMELPGISTIQKMVKEMPDEVPATSADLDIPEVSTSSESASKAQSTPNKQDRADLEQLTADYQTMPVFERKVNDAGSDDKPLSLNDRLNKGLKIGMNDRIGFIKHLFNGSDQDYNRVISQLNTIDNFDAAKRFIVTMIKPDYNGWEGKEAFESRFMELVERNY